MSIVAPLSTEEAFRLNPGVRRLVVALRALGFDTYDSGDGTESDNDFPYVAIAVPPEKLVSETDRLKKIMSDLGIQTVPQDESGNLRSIEAYYNVDAEADEHKAFIALINVCDVDLPPE